jgi:hypothetical protein
MVGFSPTAGHQSSYRLACGRPRLVLRRQSFLRLASPLPCLCLIYPRRHVLPPSLSHTLSPTSSSTSSTNSDSFRCSLRDTCDTHHIHSLNFKIPLDNRSLPPKNTLRDTYVLRRWIRWRRRWLLRWRPRRRWRIRRRVRLLSGSRIWLAELLFQWVCPTVYVL